MENMRGGGDVGGYFGAVNQMEMLERCVKLRLYGASRYIFYLIAIKYSYAGWFPPRPVAGRVCETGAYDGAALRRVEPKGGAETRVASPGK